jgi:predicted aconitase with swiveling domain
MATTIKCRPLVAGYGRGKILTTQQNISFWGGVDPASGMIIDPRHELFDQPITGKVLAFPYGKGSAAAPLVLLELAKQGTAPAAIINIEIDPLLVAGPIISKHFYGTTIPVVALPRAAFDRLQTGQTAAVDGIRGEIVIGPAE